MDKLPNFFKPAIQACEMACHHTHKIGAAIYYKRKLISVGFNDNSKMPVYIKCYDRPVSVHAEIQALRNARSFLRTCSESDLRRVKIVVFRHRKDGTPALAKPCSGCTAMLKSFGIQRGAWTTDGHWTEDCI